jgi:hypothetical protein
VVRKRGRPASEVCHRFEPVPQVLRNVRFKGSRPLGAGSPSKPRGFVPDGPPLGKENLLQGLV